MDADLVSIQHARDALHAASDAQRAFAHFTQDQTDAVVEAMIGAGAREAERLGRLAHEETGFGRAESKTQKNLFATQTLGERMRGMKTAGVLRKDGAVWEVAQPMGVVAALVPSTNPTSTALYKAILAAKARCAIVMSPHPRSAGCTAEALRVVAEAAEKAGAPAGLFHCLDPVTLAGTDALLEHPLTRVILATGGGPMVRAAYSKGKPAYGVGSGNVPVWVDRSANLAKAAADVITGVSFDWGTLCSTERSVVADAPVRARLLDELRARGGHVCSEAEASKLRAVVKKGGALNTDLVGQSPHVIARLAGFQVPETAQALIAEVEDVGPGEPLSMETLSPILSFYTADGWEAGCERCLEILDFGGIGHTLALHATSERVIEQFALKKPAMRIVVNTVAALGSVGLTTDLFPAMTLGPGAVGGSITSDNLTPLHLVNVKRVAFETTPLNSETGERLAPGAEASTQPSTKGAQASARRTQPSGPPQPSASQASSPPPRPGAGGDEGSWMDAIEARLVARAGNPPSPVGTRAEPSATSPKPSAKASGPTKEDGPEGRSASAKASVLPLPDAQIARLVRQFKK